MYGVDELCRRYGRKDFVWGWPIKGYPILEYLVPIGDPPSIDLDPVEWLTWADTGCRPTLLPKLGNSIG